MLRNYFELSINKLKNTSISELKSQMKKHIGKDKKIHLVVDWGNIEKLPEYAIKYAALDAEVTRMLGHKRFKKLCNSE